MKLLYKNPQKAITYFKAELRVSDFKECWLNLGVAHKNANQIAQARQAFVRAQSTSTPFYHGAYGACAIAENNIGLLEYERGDDVASIAYFKRALQLDPAYADARWNYSTALLRQYYSGVRVDESLMWQLFEYRLVLHPRPCVIPRWDGVAGGQSIVVLAEQGIGDHLMWGRYLRDLQELFAEVWVQCDPQLDVFFSEYHTCRLASESQAEVSVPLCSLSAVFGLGHAHWITCPDVAPEDYILVEYQGSPTHANDINRSCSPAYFTGYLGSYKLANANPGRRQVKNIQQIACASWTDTIDAVAAAKLVITVDTSLAHLCGSMNRECWLLQPLRATDYRWGNGNTSVLYPSMRIFKNPGNWDAVFKQVKEALDARNCSRTLG